MRLVRRLGGKAGDEVVNSGCSMDDPPHDRVCAGGGFYPSLQRQVPQASDEEEDLGSTDWGLVLAPVERMGSDSPWNVSSLYLSLVERAATSGR